MDYKKFSFSGRSVANNYDNELVPAIFKPWASRMVEEHGPWDGLNVLDLATGTGIVAQLLAERVGTGQVIGSDINGEMLELAKKRVPSVKFVECSADSLTFSSDLFDVVVCQQGFQFFPDKVAAAKEIYRVLRSGGKCVITTWMPITRCPFFGAICSTLEEMGEREIANNIRIPFDFMPRSDIVDALESAGFVDVQASEQEQELIGSGEQSAVKMAYGSPIGPMLRALSQDRQANFKEVLSIKIREFRKDEDSLGSLVTNLVTARKLD